MEVTVLIFGPHAAQVGSRSVTVTIDDQCTCADVLRSLGKQHDRLATLLAGGRIAVNGHLVSDDTNVTRQDELALIALVGGG